MFDGPLMIWVNLPIVDTVHSKGNKFVMSVKTKAIGDTKLTDSFNIFQYLTVRLLGSCLIKVPADEC